MHYGENFWAGIKGHLNTVTDRAAAPIIAKYTGVVAAADTASGPRSRRPSDVRVAR